MPLAAAPPPDVHVGSHGLSRRPNDAKFATSAERAFEALERHNEHVALRGRTLRGVHGAPVDRVAQRHVIITSQ
jgi:hypothetical protein